MFVEFEPSNTPNVVANLFPQYQKRAKSRKLLTKSKKRDRKTKRDRVFVNANAQNSINNKEKKLFGIEQNNALLIISIVIVSLVAIYYSEKNQNAIPAE